MKPARPSVYNADASNMTTSSDSWLIDNRESNRRAEQRRADANYALHRKLNDGSKFVIKTDAGGNIVANKLRDTSMVTKLMELYVDVTMITTRSSVWWRRSSGRTLTSNPLLSQDGFRFICAKNWRESGMNSDGAEETGQKHPDCPVSKHPAQVAWWASPAGSSRSHIRMKDMNVARANQGKSFNADGNAVSALRTSAMENNGRSRASTPTVPLFPEQEISVSEATSALPPGEVSVAFGLVRNSSLYVDKSLKNWNI
ncbi:hypothetical protein M758_UG230100 [Ceratodon purpureus]|nr:hypothetical protein M758_UG230100 [Ceratodon purpureus]